MNEILNEKYAISLFCSAGIGDLGLRANKIKTVIHNELIKNRYDLFINNYPDSKGFLGDIWGVKDSIIKYYKENYNSELFLLFATPPCQGMSSNGVGKLLSEYRRGFRAKLDERNRLIIPVLDIIEQLKPKWILFENVPNMKNTLILDKENNLVNIMDYINKCLCKNYVGKGEVVDVADYGVAQNRKRLITIYSKTSSGKEYYENCKTFLPEKTHSKNGDDNKKKWVTLRDLIYDFPKLDARVPNNENYNYHPLHKVPLLDDDKYFWVKNTGEGDTAFNNQCVNPKCKFQGNIKHGASRDSKGINKYHKHTPLYCKKCGSLLPRPWVKDKKTGELRLMKGYVSAYKRMNWDEPASTITQNFLYACSDRKLHPSQNRVLSIYEALVIQTIADYKYNFRIKGKYVNDSLIRDVIGESVPPKLIDCIVKNIVKIEEQGKKLCFRSKRGELSLF